MANKSVLTGIALVSCLAASPLARANLTEVLTERFPSHMEDATVSASFKVNEKQPELDRAWVEIEFYKPNPVDYDPGETVVVRKHVPGLRYDPDTRQVLYQETGKAPVVCANVVESSFLVFHGTKVVPTDNCQLTAEKVPAFSSRGLASGKARASRRDDSFVVHYNPVGRVVLRVKD